eukprot:6486285-Amphidinium_carterae.4
MRTYKHYERNGEYSDGFYGGFARQIWTADVTDGTERRTPMFSFKWPSQGVWVRSGRKQCAISFNLASVFLLSRERALLTLALNTELKNTIISTDSEGIKWCSKVDGSIPQPRK